MANQTRDEWLDNRVNLPTRRSSREMSKLPPEVLANAFFSSRVAEAHILERLRPISDAYSRGEITDSEAMHQMRQFLIKEGYDTHDAALSNLASTGRLELILEQNAAMAASIVQEKRELDPRAVKRRPYWRYVHGLDRRPQSSRASHKAWDGRVFRKDDPIWEWLTFPRDFRCSCGKVECDAKEAEEYGGVLDGSKFARETAASGYSFNPRHAFQKPFDLSKLESIDRARIITRAEEAVRDRQLGKCGVTAAMPTTGEPPHDLPGLDEVQNGLEAMRDGARRELESVGLDPDNPPGYKEINAKFKQPEKIPPELLAAFPEKPVTVGALAGRFGEATGMGEIPITLERGNKWFGIAHMWRDHKDVFADPNRAVQQLRDTIGDPNARCVVSLIPAVKDEVVHGKKKKQRICLRKIVIHSPEKQCYCVMVYDGKQLKVVSWHNAPREYGDGEWALK